MVGRALPRPVQPLAGLTGVFRGLGDVEQIAVLGPVVHYSGVLQEAEVPNRVDQCPEGRRGAVGKICDSRRRKREGREGAK